MLSNLRRKAARLLLETEHDTCYTSPEYEDVLVSLDLSALREVLLPKPQIPWRRVFEICTSTIVPMYKIIQDTIVTDVEHLTKLFSDMEMSQSQDDDDDLGDELPLLLPSSPPNSEDDDCIAFEAPRRQRRWRCSALEFDKPVVIPSNNNGVPTIVISPCPSDLERTSCWVPTQDASYGNRLPVPTHIPVNQVFPPLAPNQTSFLTLRRMEKWRYIDGHWWAVLPTLEEQARRGMFSKAVNMRRKARMQRRTIHR
ncbi:hypothetical protein JAAARDRAFT_29037 [Jaapia argillacea MUCL 33604]|uniref:Uncharacterized protein n=1 Tax=Jaapia argillacea MUCL 33604 TaxID=933084 RepID=A0A067Q7V8_9AGAM|nr:hypothetical protein JAAARDRAFT_29037 [Jaapia argillacea MUCL 33604]